jgi:cysteine sulfinate desulfinase/cysteine desulfurase-like protein
VIRFSLGRATTEGEIDEVVCRLPALVAAVRAPASV